MHAVRLLGQHLPDVARHDDAAVRGELVLAAVLCGQGTDHTGAGITTVLGHAIGARHALENGTVNAIVLPHVLRFNASAAAAGLAKVAAALGLPPKRVAPAEGREGGADDLRHARPAAPPARRWHSGRSAARHRRHRNGRLVSARQPEVGPRRKGAARRSRSSLVIP